MHQKLASYATDPQFSNGRLYQEEPTFRDEFQRDLNRITHSAAFRRLEYKTQVFVNDEGDHYRTRLTHSLEVAQISKVIAAELDLSLELTECLSLAHDLGHPPFGHAGEEALNEKLSTYGGFNHNEYTLKLLTQLEERYINFNGLNLTWETLDGIMKHNGPIIGKYSKHNKASEFIRECAKNHNISLDKFPSLEAQVSAIADDIAYNSHDLEDGLRAGLFSIKDVCNCDIINDIIDEVNNIKQGAEEQRVIHEIIRRLTNQMVIDVITQTQTNIRSLNIKNLNDVYDANIKIVDFSLPMQKKVSKLKKYLLDNMYKHYTVNVMTYKGRKIIKELFETFLANPGCLPTKWQGKINKDQTNLPIVIANYIAGMTDRYAIKEHKMLCSF
jgi:dGTPase